MMCRPFEQSRFLEGPWIWMQYDCYGREQNSDLLLGRDISVDRLGGGKAVLQVGDRQRGQCVKSGSDQTVQLDYPIFSSIVAAISRERSPNQSFFIFRQERIRNIRNEELAAMGVATVGPLRSSRHSKPSRDVGEKERTLDEVRRRGRWSQKKNVQRSSRTHCSACFPNEA